MKLQLGNTMALIGRISYSWERWIVLYNRRDTRQLKIQSSKMTVEKIIIRPEVIRQEERKRSLPHFHYPMPRRYRDCASVAINHALITDIAFFFSSSLARSLLNSDFGGTILL